MSSLPNIPDNELADMYLKSKEEQIIKKYSELGRTICNCFLEDPNIIINQNLKISSRHIFARETHSGFSFCLPQKFNGNNILYERKELTRDNAEILGCYVKPTKYQPFLMINTDLQPLEEGIMVLEDVLDNSKIDELEKYFNKILAEHKATENVKHGIQKTL